MSEQWSRDSQEVLGRCLAPKSQSSSSLARIDVQGVQGAPKASGSNGFDLDTRGGQVRCVQPLR